MQPMLHLMVQVGPGQDQDQSLSQKTGTHDPVYETITETYETQKNVGIGQHCPSLSGQKRSQPPFGSKGECFQADEQVTENSIEEIVFAALYQLADETGYGEVTQTSLACSLKLTRPTVSRAMRWLKKNGYITRKSSRKWYRILRIPGVEKPSKQDRDLETLKGMVRSLNVERRMKLLSFIKDLTKAEIEAAKGGLK